MLPLVEKACTRGELSRAWGTPLITRAHLGWHVVFQYARCLLYMRLTCSMKTAAETEPKCPGKQNNKMRFDCAGACGLHLSPQHGARKNINIPHEIPNIFLLLGEKHLGEGSRKRASGMRQLSRHLRRTSEGKHLGVNI